MVKDGYIYLPNGVKISVWRAKRVGFKERVAHSEKVFRDGTRVPVHHHDEVMYPFGILRVLKNDN